MKYRLAERLIFRYMSLFLTNVTNLNVMVHVLEPSAYVQLIKMALRVVTLVSYIY